MKQADQKRLSELCSLIAHERSSDKFSALVEELNRLLDKEEERLEDIDHHQLAS